MIREKNLDSNLEKISDLYTYGFWIKVFRLKPKKMLIRKTWIRTLPTKSPFFHSPIILMRQLTDPDIQKSEPSKNRILFRRKYLDPNLAYKAAHNSFAYNSYEAIYESGYSEIRYFENPDAILKKIPGSGFYGFLLVVI